jgi:hypothetical protein
VYRVFAMPETNLFWDQLTQLVEEGCVVPIVGRDLQILRHEGSETLLYPWLAKRLAAYLGVSGGDPPDVGDLNDVVCRFLAKGNQVEDVYPAIKSIMPKEDELPIPEPLLRLAEIRPFNLFVSTTFDPLMERALNQVRFGGAPHTEVVVYSPEEREDLPPDWSRRERPTVFYLFGRVSATPAYAVTQEDTLEFVHSLQSETRQPSLLLDELNRRSLLIIGSSFGGWLARFFIRAARRERLLRGHGRTDYVADTRILEDPGLVLFLRHFANRTKVFEGGGAVDFVNELHRRWSERNPAAGTEPAVEGEETGPTPGPAADTEPGAVFLSYASEDRDEAACIRDALETAGVDVFFDKDDLQAGDAWDVRLRHVISRSSLFVPVISQHTLTIERRYFRTEWNEAIDEARKAAPNDVFILPVVIDDTAPTVDALPEQFRALEWTRLPGGRPDPRFVALVRGLFRKHQKVLAGNP